ncbi:hypothetical protein ACEPAH_1715 [Sanghuangporus vaninii]
MALALSQSQSGTTTSYMSTSASSSYWSDADASTAAFSPSAGVPGGSTSSNAMPYNTAPHAGVGANSSSLYSVHHQGINPTAHHSYGGKYKLFSDLGYSDHGESQGHPTSWHNPAHTQSHLSQAQVQRPGSGMTGGMRRSPATSSSSSPGGSSSSSLQYALRPHGHSHHSPLSVVLAPTTGSGGTGGVSSSSAFSPSSGSSGSSGSSSLVSSLALSSLSNSNANANSNSNSNSSVSPISPQHPHAHHHFYHGHSQIQQQHHEQSTQQYQNNHSRNQNQTSYVHSHAYPVSGSGAAAGSGSGMSGSAAYHQIPSTGLTNSSNNTNNHAGQAAPMTANSDVHGGLYTFDSPEPSNPPAFESDFGSSGSPPSGAYRTAHLNSHSHSHAHAYPRLQIPTGAQQSGYGNGHGHGYSHTPVSPHVQSRTSSAYAHAVNGYGNDTPVSEVPPGSYITRDRSGSIRSRGRGSARVKTEPDLLEESRSLERSPDLSHGIATPSKEGGSGGGGGGDGGGGARFVMEHPYPYIYATTRDDRRDQSPRSFSPPSPSSLTPAKNGPLGHPDYSSGLFSDREQKNDAQQVQATPHTLTAPLRAVNASAEMRQCMGVFRLDPFAQLNGVALRCGFVSSFDDAGFSGKKSGNKNKSKSKGKKGGKNDKKRGSARKKTRKNAAGRALESDDEDTILGSDITDEERGEDEEEEGSDDNTPTWDGLPAGPLAEEPVLIEFQLYFDGMEVDEGDDECLGGGDDAEDMKVLDPNAKWEGQDREEDIDEGDFTTFDKSDSPGTLRYGRSRAYSYSAAAVAEAAARDKGAATATDARRYRVIEDAHRDRYSDGVEYTNNNASSSLSGPRRGPEYEREPESHDRKLQLASRSHHPIQTQSRAAPPTPRAMATSRTLGVFEEYLSLDLGGIDDINMDMTEMNGWGSGGTSPSTPYALMQDDGALFTTNIAQTQRTGGSNSTSTRPAVVAGTITVNNNNNSISSSADSGGASSSLHPNTNTNSFPSASVSGSSPVLPSSSSSPYSNEFTNGGPVRARYIDSSGYMRFSDSMQIPSSASVSTNPTSNPSSSPSPFYGLTTGAAAAGAAGTNNAADDTVTLQQLRTQAALRAVSAHAAAQTQSQGMHGHGLYRGSPETGSAANAHHRLAGASGSGNGVSGGGAGAAGTMGAGPAPVNFTPTPASIAAEMHTGLLTSGRLGAAKPSFGQGQGQGQVGSAYHAYSQSQSQSMSSESPSTAIPSSSSSSSNSGYSAYPDYSSGLPNSSSMSGSFGQNHGHDHDHDHNHGHGHGGNQSVQALERRWSDVLQRVHG